MRLCVSQIDASPRREGPATHLDSRGTLTPSSSLTQTAPSSTLFSDYSELSVLVLTTNGAWLSGWRGARG